MAPSSASAAGCRVMPLGDWPGTEPVPRGRAVGQGQRDRGCPATHAMPRPLVAAVACPQPQRRRGRAEGPRRPDPAPEPRGRPREGAAPSRDGPTDAHALPPKLPAGLAPCGSAGSIPASARLRARSNPRRARELLEVKSNPPSPEQPPRICRVGIGSARRRCPGGRFPSPVGGAKEGQPSPGQIPISCPFYAKSRRNLGAGVRTALGDLGRGSGGRGDPAVRGWHILAPELRLSLSSWFFELGFLGPGHGGLNRAERVNWGVRSGPGMRSC